MESIYLIELPGLQFLFFPVRVFEPIGQMKNEFRKTKLDMEEEVKSKLISEILLAGNKPAARPGFQSSPTPPVPPSTATGLEPRLGTTFVPPFRWSWQIVIDGWLSAGDGVGRWLFGEREVQDTESAPAVFHTRDGRVLHVAGTEAIAFGDYHIPNVSYIPQLGLRTTLVSVQQLAGCGFFTLVSGGCCLLRHQGDGSLVGRPRLHQDDGLYHL
uniref:Uncharacterized protein n=1 Tax=Oryza glaberrima TaxID=4538 RepID=A0A679BBQ3_ORYGL|nr:hypothetical protein [Oryza glaberrima]